MISRSHVCKLFVFYESWHHLQVIWYPWLTAGNLPQAGQGTRGCPGGARQHPEAAG